MRIGENYPFGSQLIHVRRPGLGIALQHAIPIVEIIDGNNSTFGFWSWRPASFPSLSLPITQYRKTDKASIVGCLLVFIVEESLQEGHGEHLVDLLNESVLQVRNLTSGLMHEKHAHQFSAPVNSQVRSQRAAVEHEISEAGI